MQRADEDQGTERRTRRETTEAALAARAARTKDAQRRTDDGRKMEPGSDAAAGVLQRLADPLAVQNDTANFAAGWLRTRSLSRSDLALAPSVAQSLCGPKTAAPANTALLKASVDGRRPQEVSEAELRALGAGAPLSTAMIEALAPQLQAAGVALDLAQVRVHTGDAADRLCQRLGATAFTSGHHIAFRAGAYRPASRDGMALLAHELTHVGQFHTGEVNASVGALPLLQEQGLEGAADRVAASVRATAPLAAPGVPLAGQADAARSSEESNRATATPAYGPVQLQVADRNAAAEETAAQTQSPPNHFVDLPGGHRMSDAVHSAFTAAVNQVRALTGIDISTGLGDSVRNLANATTKVGADNFSWHKTGRAVDLDQSKAWVIREDASGGDMKFRLYLEKLAAPAAPAVSAAAAPGTEAGARAGPEVQPAQQGGGAAQAGQAAAPAAPTLGGDVTFERGTTFHYNAHGNRVFRKTFVDVTSILEAQGFMRIRAQRGWESSYNKREWWHYQKDEGLTWYAALQQVYGEQELYDKLTQLLRNAGLEQFPERTSVPNPLPEPAQSANAGQGRQAGQVPRPRRRPVQRKEVPGAKVSPSAVLNAADEALSGAGRKLPHLEALQRAFVGHDLSGIQASVGGSGVDVCADMGAEAFASGERVVFASEPSLHTAAHEVAHVIQQRRGVTLDGGVGNAGDAYERQADMVADRVVSGGSVDSLLDGSGTSERRSDAPVDRLASRARDGGGEALPGAVRQAVEAAAGVTLGDVRVHRDAESRSVSAALDARAVTVGHAVLLGDDAPSLNSREGFGLLAHEAAHTAQSEPVTADGAVTVGQRHTGAEAQASQVAEVALTRSLGVAQGAVALSKGVGAVAQRDEPPSLTETLGAIAAIQNGRSPGELRLQRSAEGDEIRWGALIIPTFEVAASVFGQMGDSVTRKRSDGPTLTEPVATQANEFVEAMSSWGAMYRRTPNERVGQGTLVLLTQYSTDFVAVHQAMDRLRTAAAQRELQAHADELAAREATYADSEMAARERLRTAFQSGDTSAIRQATDLIGAILDSALALGEMGREMRRAISELRGTTLPEVSRYVGYLNALNRFIAAGQLIATVTEVAAGRPPPTEIHAASTHIQQISTVFSAGGTILGLAPHISLYSNLYLGPMCQRIGELLVRLGEQLHGQNSEAVQFDPGLVRWGVEPGGRPMYDYMVQVFTSASAAAPTGDVATYFFDHRAQFEAAAGSPLPITGIYGFRTLDAEAFPTWVRAHRERVWSSLYGRWAYPSSDSSARR